MNRRLCCFFLVVVSCSAVTFAADLPAQWRAWRYSRAIGGIPVDWHDPAIVQLPWDLFQHSNFANSDLRIIDKSGRETPFFSPSNDSEETRTKTVPSAILERSFVPGQFTQITLQVTNRPPLDERHGVSLEQLQAEPWFNTYKILTPENDFMYWVETSVSDDAHGWRVIDSRSPVSRFRKHGLEGNQTIQFGGYSNQRFLRIRIFDQAEQFTVDNVVVLSQHSQSNPPRSVISAAFHAESSPSATESQWSADLGTPYLPISELDFSSEQPEFYRAVRISTSQDGREWSYQSSGEIYRFHSGDQTKENLRIRFPESFARFWRVNIVNGSDPSLSNVAVQLLGLDRTITFRFENGHEYRLIYGNAKAAEPKYDFAQVFPQTSKKVLPLATIGHEELTSNYADPRPFTERHPGFLFLALAIAVVFLGLSALRAMRPPQLSPE
jgi:hypothetical protein